MRILLTGATGRVGKSLGLRLLAAGHEVWGVSQSPSEIPFSGYSICDVCNPLELTTILLAELHKAGWQYLDALNLAAARNETKGPSVSIPLEKWSTPIRTCLEGSFYPIATLFQLLKISPSPYRRKVLCFSGGGADRGFEGQGAYAAAKAGLVRLVETLSIEWVQEPIDINIIAPGSHRIPRSSLQGKTILESPEFEKLFQMVSFLLSNQSDGFSGKWVSAQIHPVDFLRTNLSTLIANPDEFTLRPKTPIMGETEKKQSVLRRLKSFIRRKVLPL